MNGNLNLHEWHGWCGHAVDDLRREPLFPFKPHVCYLAVSKSEKTLNMSWYANYGRFPIGRSRSEFVIQNHSDRGESKETMNP